MTQEVTLAAEASLVSVRLLAAAFRGVLGEWRVPEKRGAILELALVEAATNVVRHAYRGRAPGRIEVSLRRDGPALAISVADCGAPFDPDLVPAPPEPDPDDPSTWPEGGMGLPIIRSACDSLSYLSEGGTNRLTMRVVVPELGAA